MVVGFNQNRITLTKPPINIEKKVKLTVAPLIDIEQIFNTSTHIYVVYDASLSMASNSVNTGPVAREEFYSDGREKSRWWAQMVGLISLFREIQFLAQQSARLLPFVTEDGADFIISETGEIFTTDSSFSNIRHSVQTVAMIDSVDNVLPVNRTRITFEGFDMSIEDMDDLINYLRFDRDKRGLLGPTDPFDLGRFTDYGAGMSFAPAFFESAGSNKKVVLFFTDGGANPPETLPPAVEIADQLGAAGVDIYAFNLMLDKTDDTEQLDNTPADGVPILNSFSALSWGLWQTVVAPVTYRMMKTPVTPEQTYQTAAVLTRFDLYNPNATDVAVTVRYRKPDEADEPKVSRRITLTPGEQRGIGLEGDIVAAGEVIQATCPIGQNFQISATYLERTEEPIT